MKPWSHDIDIYRGDDWDETVRIRSRVWNPALNGGEGGYEKGPYVNVSAWTGIFQVRLKPDDPDVIATGTVTPTDQNAILGGITYAMPATETVKLPAGKLRYDLQLTNDAGKKTTYLAGYAQCTKDVSRP